MSHATVDPHIEGAQTLTQTFALGLFGAVSKGGQVLPWLSENHGSWAASVFKACQKEVHAAGAGPLETLVKDAQRLADKVRKP